MSREIKSANQQLPAAAPNDFKDRLLKLIPVEIITAYITIAGIIKSSSNGKLDELNHLLLIVILILVILTPVYQMKILQISKIGQIIFSTIGFLIWAFATAAPITITNVIDGYSSDLIISLVLILYTLLIPLIYKG
ncbi:hypothetical protein [Flavobacterium marginilacus]|uniref:hypothetical protein n=1 Tax=Flavobacterium marginilacus TaxID=3003256 RepID=UPI00248D8D76|nr:hypothetical protein [Flavobacterium marginilacus]